LTHNFFLCIIFIKLNLHLNLKNKGDIKMISEKQLTANQNNALRSTGPRTGKGKAAAAQNSLKHGLRTDKTVLNTESQLDFDHHQTQLLAELAPDGPTERVLADRIVELSWRLARANRFRTAAFNSLQKSSAPTKLDKLRRSVQGLAPPPAEPDLGDIIVNDFKTTRILERLLMYERRIENSLRKMMLDFQRIKLLRQYEAFTTPQDPLTKSF
jgi:hypothetical protein